MLDRPVRARLGPGLDVAAGWLAGRGVRPGHLTALGFGLGVGAAAAAGFGRWWIALVLWLVSRVADGLDGAVARAGTGPTALGAWLDVVADFTVYGAFVIGAAIGQPDARVPLLVLLGTYYANGATVLALAAAEARGDATTGQRDERGIVLTRGLAEGTETIVAHALLVAVPAWMGTTAWVFAAMVAVTALQRVALARRVLR